MRPIVLTIAGSDPSGGAGIQADLKAIEANGGYAAAAITAITVQNTRGVTRASALAADIVREQLEAVFSDLHVQALKSGVLGSSAIIRELAAVVRDRRPPAYVLDPVMSASDGFPLLPASDLEVLRHELLPLATLVTPNVAEAEALSGIEVSDLEGAERAGRRLLETGCATVLIKGGHLRGSPATDLLVTASDSQTFPGNYIDTPHTHGTGCIYSAAIATQLARGRPLAAAIERAKRFVTEALRHGLPAGRGHGPTDPFYFLCDEDDNTRVGSTRRGASGP